MRRADPAVLGTMRTEPLREWSVEELRLASRIRWARLYRALERLEAAGAVQVRWAPGMAPYRPKRLYRLTLRDTGSE